MPKGAAELLSESKVALLSSLFEPPLSQNVKNANVNGRGAGKASPTTPTVCMQFKEQLQQLMEKISTTKPHYIRCLKPNDENKPGLFNRLRTGEQLRYGGVLEAVRVSRSGFPYRMSHVDFFNRYRCIVNKSDHLPRRITAQHLDKVELCKSLISEILAKTSTVNVGIPFKKGDTLHDCEKPIVEDELQLGKTKVFLRKTPYDLLEARRSKLLYSFAVTIQAIIRMHLYRRWLHRLRNATLYLQRYFRIVEARVRTKRRIERRKMKRLHEIAAQDAVAKAAELQAKAEKLAQEVVFKRIAAEAAATAERRNSVKDAEIKAALEKARDAEDAKRKAEEAALLAKSLEEKAKEDIYLQDQLLPELPASVRAAIVRTMAHKSFTVGPVFNKSPRWSGKSNFSDDLQLRNPEVTEEDYAQVEISPDVKVARLFNKHATKIDKELYKKQFPKAWPAVTLADIFGLDEK